MVYRSLQDLIDEDVDIIHHLRSSKSGMSIYPVVAAEFSNWRDEQRSWQQSVSLFDQSHHMHEITVEGPDAFEFLEGLAVNSFKNFGIDRAKQFVAVNPEGYLIGDMIAFREKEDQFVLVGRPPVANWIEFNMAISGKSVRIRREAASPQRPDGKAVTRTYYRFQIQGPQANQVIERINGGPIPEIKFFNVGEIRVGTKTVRALRHGMAGAPGLEIWGPYDDKPYIREVILQAGRDLGLDLRQVGGRAYPTNTLESGWISSPLAAVYTGEGIMRKYREWLPATSMEASGGLGGSFDSDDIRDFYLTPYELGYGGIINFDHEFIGREALMAMKDKPQRKKVTFEWNADDVLKVIASAFRPGEENYKWIDFPRMAYGSVLMDKVLKNGNIVGASLFAGYSFNERCMLSLGVVDQEIQTGDVLTLVWGDADGGVGLASTERHKQTEIRVRVSPTPYARQAREDYASGWRTA